MKIKIVNKSNHNILPSYETVGSAGMDIKANLDEPISLHPMDRVVVPTGLYVSIPEGYEVQIRPRSGLAAKKGITVLNSPGTIDSDFRGEMKVILINLSKDVFIVNPGDRIAQMVAAKYEKIDFEEVAELDETVRGEGGLGHTGEK